MGPYEVVRQPGGSWFCVQETGNPEGRMVSFMPQSTATVIADAMNKAYERGRNDLSEELNK